MVSHKATRNTICLSRTSAVSRSGCALHLGEVCAGRTSPDLCSQPGLISVDCRAAAQHRFCPQKEKKRCLTAYLQRLLLHICPTHLSPVGTKLDVLRSPNTAGLTCSGDTAPTLDTQGCGGRVTCIRGLMVSSMLENNFKPWADQHHRQLWTGPSNSSGGREWMVESQGYELMPSGTHRSKSPGSPVLPPLLAARMHVK